MSTTRISLTDSGIRFTFVRMRSSSARPWPGQERTAIGPVGGELGVDQLLDAGGEPSGSGSNSKSMRAASGSMFPPVTGTRHSFQITPHSTCSAVWVRISRWRRSQSSSPAPCADPGVGARPPSVVPHHVALLAASSLNTCGHGQRAGRRRRGGGARCRGAGRRRWGRRSCGRGRRRRPAGRPRWRRAPAGRRRAGRR